jgi:hypothetical protein
MACNCKSELIMHFIEKELRSKLKLFKEGNQHIVYYEHLEEIVDNVDELKKLNNEELEELVLKGI